MIEKSVSLIKSIDKYHINSLNQDDRGVWVPGQSTIVLETSEPYSEIVSSIKLALENSTQNYTEPENWKAHRDEISKQLGFKNQKEKYREGNLHLIVSFINNQFRIITSELRFNPKGFFYHKINPELSDLKELNGDILRKALSLCK